MTVALWFAIAGGAVSALALWGVLVQRDPLRQIIALNMMGSGVFLVFVAQASRASHAAADPVPQAMVLTGIVVTVGATALALALICRLRAVTWARKSRTEDRHDAQ